MKTLTNRPQHAAWLLLTGLITLGAWPLTTPAAAAPRPTPKAGAKVASKPGKPAFTAAAAAWREVQAQLADLRQTVRDGRLDEVHAVAFELRDQVRVLADRSAALTAADRLRLTQHVRRVEQLAEGLDRSGDAGDRAATTRQLQTLAGVLASIEKLYPKGALLAAAPSGPDAAPSKERLLYLTPGGAYTEADIKANGNQLPAQKFRGVKVNHDLKPAVGDRICPVTLTKANPGYSWTIGSKEYLFCCPPCLEEFLTKAKQDPASVRPPETYIKQAG